MPKAFNFGRLFFPGRATPIPDEVRFQPLGNHVGNVMKLVKCWHENDFPNPDSLSRVLEAAKIHDMGKPKHFAIQSEIDQNGKFKKYIYSFKGHRFDARSSDLWAKMLAIGHHDFSVRDITRDAYKLRKEPQYAAILAQYPLAYARELYILEMCDQIEAELACRVLGDDDQAESRAFMEFTITSNQDKTVYFVDPWPFAQISISLTFRHWSVSPVDIDQKQELQECLTGKNRKKESDLGKTLDRLVKDWWRNQAEIPKENEPRTISLQPYQSINIARIWTAEEFYKQLADFKPTPMQLEVFDAIYDSDQTHHPAILLKAPTGTGKTESIVFPALASGYRLILILPVRSLLDDQKKRVENYLKQFSKLNPEQEFSLVVDTGSQMYRWIYKNGVDSPSRTKNLRRHLYKADIILTTLDKFLYRYFAFGDKQKSFIFPLRIHEATTHKKQTLICFDEAHSYDEISFTNFQSLVRSLYEAGRSLVLMTATMPLQLEREYFDYLQVIDYTKQLSQQPQRSLAWLRDIKCYQESDDHNKDFADFQEQVSQIVLKEWQAKTDCRIITVVETVRDATAIYQHLKNQFGSDTNESGQFLFLYHGRIADQLRPELYKQIKQRDSDKKPYILVTTSAIEVGCDLNAEILISQICPPENLIQRAGRCNRRGDVPDAKMIVVGDRIPEFANTLDNNGWLRYQEVLCSLKTFDTDAITDCISHTPHIDDYRVVEVFSMLHDYVYGADLTCQPTHERGLIPTRSWEPTAELRLMFSDKDYHSISVPISRLAQKNNKQYAFVYAFERRYDKDNTRWHECPMGWGSAYDKDIIIKISPDLNEFIFDNSLPHYPYDPKLGFVELPKIFSAKWVDGAEVKLKYEVNKRDGDKHIAIISYTHS
jgi:CRISPR-associated endonuclease/helicase Cas3